MDVMTHAVWMNSLKKGVLVTGSSKWQNISYTAMKQEKFREPEERRICTLSSMFA